MSDKTEREEWSDRMAKRVGVSLCPELDRISLILQWSAAMHKAGHMPADVAKAFDVHFGFGGLDEPRNWNDENKPDEGKKK